MDISTLTLDELRILRKECSERIHEIHVREFISEAKATNTFTPYSYIIFQDEFMETGEWRIGFNRHNDPGFIDDHVPEEEAELYSNMLEVVGVGYETNSCTYDLDPSNRDAIEKCLQELGIKPMEPAWV